MNDSMATFEILRASDHSYLVSFGSSISLEVHRKVLAFLSLTTAQNMKGVRHIQPAYTSVLVRFDSAENNADVVLRDLILLANQVDSVTLKAAHRKIEVPVCYDEDFGPDLKDLAKLCKMPVTEVVKRHSSSEYRVYFLGFMPGFGYLGGLDPKLAAPRLAVPREVVPEGSVGLAGNQTGIYPFATPGGWRLIGRTPLKIFDPKREPASLFAPGDQVTFRPISLSTYEELRQL